MQVRTIQRSKRYLLAALLRILLVLASIPAIAAGAADAPRLSADAVLDHLNAVIAWYRQIKAADPTAGQPGDTIYLDNARNLSRRTLQTAFQAADAQAPVIDALPQAPEQPNGNESNAPSQEARLVKAAADADDHVRQLQAQIDALGKAIRATPARRRHNLTVQKEKLEADLQLATALRDALRNLVTLTHGGDSAPSGLAGKIGEIKRALPEASAASANPDTKDEKAASPPAQIESGGLIGDVSLLVTRVHQLHDAEKLTAATTQLQNEVKQLLAPLQTSIRDIIKKGNDASQQSASGTPAQMDAVRQQLSQLTAQFKQLSGAALPLHQEALLLDQSQSALEQWQGSVHKEYNRALRDVLVQIAMIAAALCVVLMVAELWRRATLRYVHDLRRRRQLTILRRSVSGVIMALVLIGGFVREISSLATFAGFLTAGIAVALQTVLLSVAAYFFLIGRYGVRVGDRITVSGITGIVVEVGLVRIYLLELSSTGVDPYPTGRLVAFSNSVLFQSAPFFKQVPGTSYTWREVVVTFRPDSDFSAAERRILEAINAIYEQYRGDIQRQHNSFERFFDFEIPMPAPHAHLQLTRDGLEFVVRYPVEIPHSAEIDEKVTRQLAEVIHSAPDVKNSVTAMPQIRSAIKT
jgi:small-conductance mechanosensitive channel